MSDDLKYETATKGMEQVLVRGRFAKADVFITRSAECRFIVKDFTRKGFWERNIIGRIVIGREVRAYTALGDIEGIPARFRRLSPFSLAVEYLDGRDLGDADRTMVGPDVVRQFERIIEGLHERGWVHLDLHRRSNILLVDGRVFVVDLASALHPGGVPLVGRFLTRVIGIADRLSLIKMKTLFAPECLTPREQRTLSFRNKIMPTKWESR